MGGAGVRAEPPDGGLFRSMAFPALKGACGAVFFEKPMPLG